MVNKKKKGLSNTAVETGDPSSMTRAGPWGRGNCEKLQHKPETEIFTHEEKAQNFLKCIVCLVHVAVIHSFHCPSSR